MSATEPDRLRAEGRERYERGDLPAALAACQELVALEPLNAEALNDLGTVLFALGRVEESVRHYARALELRADYGPAQENLDMVAQFTGRTVEALIKGTRPEPTPSAPLVTALLLNYKRPQNMQRVLDCLAAQTVPVQVYLWNNGDPLTVRCNGDGQPVPVEQHPLVRLVVTPTSNLRCWPRWLLGSMADTEFLCTLDDDLVLADERVLEDAVRVSREKCPDGVVGFFGWRRVPGRSYRKSQHVNGSHEDCWVDLIKGRFMLLRRGLLERVPLLHPVFRATPDCRGRADDIYVNVCVSGGRPGAHLVPGALGKRYVELSECGVALRDEPGHREERDELVRSMFSLYAPPAGGAALPAQAKDERAGARRRPADATHVERGEAPSCDPSPARAAAPEPPRSGGAPEQLRLLRETPWDVLVVLDACRSDYFREVTGQGVTALSPANCTAHWVPRVGPFLAESDPVYFTANPVVDREIEKLGLGIELVSVWKDLWARHTAWRIPSVHPLSVNGVVSAYRRLGRLKGRKAVVHYIQPHSPYIGSLPLAMARWSEGRPGSFHAACARLPRPTWRWPAAPWTGPWSGTRTRPTWNSSGRQ